MKRIDHLFAIPFVSHKNVLSETERLVLLNQVLGDYEKNKDFVVLDWDGDVNSSLHRKETDFIDYKILEKHIAVLHNTVKQGMKDHKSFIKYIWYNVYNRGYSQEPHNHLGGDGGLCTFSGVYYLQLNKEDPGITFWNPSNIHMSRVNLEYVSTTDAVLNHGYGFEKFRYQPSQNELILFPSFLTHSVPVQRSDNQRISISFNIFIEE